MMTRYLAGLSVAGLGLCGGGWLMVTAEVFGGEAGQAGRLNLATGAGLALVGCVTAVAWAVAWRRRLRADGVLAGPCSQAARMSPVSRREARRNRRQLARDVRRAARLSKRMAREDRRAGRRPEPPWNGGHLGDGWHPAFGPPGRRRGRVPAGDRPDYAGHGAAGHDGASAADLLGELRALLGPLLAAARPAPTPLARPAPPPLARPAPTPLARPAPTPLAPPLVDSDEAWW